MDLPYIGWNQSLVQLTYFVLYFFFRPHPLNGGMCIHAIPGTCGFQKTWINKMNGKQCLAQLTLDNEYLLIMILTIRRAGHKTTISIPILCHWPTNTFMSLQISFSFFFFFKSNRDFFLHIIHECHSTNCWEIFSLYNLDNAYKDNAGNVIFL